MFFKLTVTEKEVRERKTSFHPACYRKNKIHQNCVAVFLLNLQDK